MTSRSAVHSEHKILGIIGGMGSEATAEFFRSIVQATTVTCDQDHLHVLINNDPRVPDRTASILGEGRDPLPMLVHAAQRLEKAGASLLAMPCNTAHHWLVPLRERIATPILDMIGLTVDRVTDTLPGTSPVAILATEGTLRASLYQECLQSAGYAALVPDADAQSIVTEAIYSVKVGGHNHSRRLREVAENLERQGARGLILGCTELPLLAEKLPVQIPKFDSLQVLAEEAVRMMRSD